MKIAMFYCEDIKMELAREDESITLVRAALGPPDDSESDIIETVLQLESDRKSSILSNTSNPQSTSSSINLPVTVPMKLETVKIEEYQPTVPQPPPPPQGEGSRCDVVPQLTFHDITTDFSVNPQKPLPPPLEKEDEQNDYVLLKLDGKSSIGKEPQRRISQSINRPSGSSEMITDKTPSENKKHKCAYPGCERSFVRPAELLRHKRTHTNERPYVCPTCNHEFKRKDHLKSHILIHTDEKKYSCKRCDYRTNRLDTLKRHFKTRHQKLGGPPEDCPSKAKKNDFQSEY
ncbi:Oidioi.mRNA.OKI2018_I69.PAR.g11777.t1.cds [Oikopleura dioica]|uniref:Oidioi.mRNA.OKI2018_I69.PAR.g11777.t1.cds n=1 Tax=Oikopleura dioica TaxID=34765 RepID=A0ABN7RX76_OIKDI|nr:Oidioi.mRNA.OKI2018_I69.PAR.g11777.t1.cds [Oikopleura dioica]